MVKLCHSTPCIGYLTIPAPCKAWPPIQHQPQAVKHKNNTKSADKMRLEANYDADSLEKHVQQHTRLFRLAEAEERAER